MKALFSLKPHYAHAIMEGRKSIEVRRGCIRQAITSMVVYATKPEGVVFGTVNVAKIEHFIAEDFRRFLILRRDPIEADYLRYVSGAKWVTVLHLANPRRLVRPMSLEELAPGLRATQMWCRLDIELSHKL